MRDARLRVDPCIPRGWPGYEVVFAPEGARYRIEVENPDGVSRGVVRIEVDGREIQGDVPIVRDGREHHVRVLLGAEPTDSESDHLSRR
jgi:cellobiose phosphorylase